MLNQDQLIKDAKTKNLLLDTGPLVLLLVGSYNNEKIASLTVGSKKFETEDFKLLLSFLKGFDLFITPHILAEASNIIGKYIRKNEFEKVISMNKKFLKEGVLEIYIKKDEILDNEIALKIGITDTSIILASTNKIVLTIDEPLLGICKKNGIYACRLDEITCIKWLKN